MKKLSLFVTSLVAVGYVGAARADKVVADTCDQGVCVNAVCHDGPGVTCPIVHVAVVRDQAPAPVVASTPTTAPPPKAELAPDLGDVGPAPAKPAPRVAAPSPAPAATATLKLELVAPPVATPPALDLTTPTPPPAPAAPTKPSSHAALWWTIGTVAAVATVAGGVAVYAATRSEFTPHRVPTPPQQGSSSAAIHGGFVAGSGGVGFAF